MKYIIDSDGKINKRCAIQVNGDFVADLDTAIKVAENLEDCSDVVIIEDEKFAVIHVYDPKANLNSDHQKVHGKATGINHDFFNKN